VFASIHHKYGTTIFFSSKSKESGHQPKRDTKALTSGPADQCSRDTRGRANHSLERVTSGEAAIDAYRRDTSQLPPPPEV
jgi:hypothetical protein